MKKGFLAVFIISFLAVCAFNQIGYSQSSRDVGPFDQSRDLLKGFIHDLTQAISYRTADMAFDYTQRPIIGIIAADFTNPKGQEIALGNEIGTELRAILNKGRQFHVYGKDHPVSQSLKTALIEDPRWSGASQRKFQQNLQEYFKPFPVDVIITGQISRETTTEGERIKCSVLLSPFLETISLVEGESGRKNLQKADFFSPFLPPGTLRGSLSAMTIPVASKGRLVILSALGLDKRRTEGGDSKTPERGTQRRMRPLSTDNNWKLNSIKDLNCWLDDKPLEVLKDWPADKKKTYYNLLSGLEADTIWLDDAVPEGRHTLFISLAQDPTKNHYKTFSQPFTLKGEQANYLMFSLRTDPIGEASIQIQQIIDPKNQPVPF